MLGEEQRPELLPPLPSSGPLGCSPAPPPRGMQVWIIHYVPELHPHGTEGALALAEA